MLTMPVQLQGWGLLKEVWSPYTGADYAEIFKQKADADRIPGVVSKGSNDVYKDLDVNTSGVTNIVL